MIRCLETKSPAEYYEVEASLTVRGNLDKPSINEMIRSLDVPRPFVASLIDTQVEILVQTLNLGMTLNEFQKVDMVQSMMEQYPNESLHDFMLCFKMAKNGLLGPIYNRIDRQVIHQWMSKYLELKAIELEALQASGSFTEPVIEDPRKLSEEERKKRREDYIQSVKDGAHIRIKREKIAEDSAKQEYIKQMKEDEYKSYRSDYLSKQKDLHARGSVAIVNNPGAIEDLPIPNPGAGRKSNRVRGNRQKPSK